MDIRRRLSAIVLLAISLIAARPVESGLSCSNFQFSTEINKDGIGGHYMVTVNASGGKMPYKFLLLNNKNTLVSTNFSDNVFRDLEPGRYRCIVADKDDCSVEKYIDVK